MIVDDSALVEHLSGLQVPILELQANSMTVYGNAFVGFQHIFGESGTFAFQMSIKLALCHRLLPMAIQDTPLSLETF